MERSVWIIGGLVAATLTSSGHEAVARNIFDDFAATFFGAPSRPAQTYYYLPDSGDGPLEMTVTKRRRASSPRYPEVSSKPIPPIVELDPEKDPNWFLKDPTLRRGDIVVTRQGVLVYNGRHSDASRRSDFASLGGKSGGATWQRQLKAAAAGGRSYFAEDGAPIRNIEATAR